MRRLIPELMAPINVSEKLTRWAEIVSPVSEEVTAPQEKEEPH